jgi:hypothetical protein
MMVEQRPLKEFQCGIGREDRALLGSNSSAHADAVNPWGKDNLLPGMNQQNQLVYGQKAKNPGVWGSAPKSTVFPLVFWKMIDRCNICEDLRGGLGAAQRGLGISPEWRVDEVDLVDDMDLIRGFFKSRVMIPKVAQASSLWPSGLRHRQDACATFYRDIIFENRYSMMDSVGLVSIRGKCISVFKERVYQ